MFNKQPRKYLAVAIIVAIVLFYGYSNIRRKDSPQEGGSLRSLMSAAKSPFDVPASRFANTETLRKVRSPELIAEINEIIDQEGLPGDVFVDRLSKEENDNDNIALTLFNLFHEFDAQSPNDLQKLWESSPIGVWDVDTQKLGSVQTILTQFESKRQKIRTQLRQSNTTFYYIFIRPESLKSVFYRGIVVNTEASRYLADYALLEEYAIAQALSEGNIGAAVEALAYIFRIAQLASTLGNVGVRSDAALVRLRAFDIMQRVVLDPKFDKAQMLVLQKMLAEQQQHWQSESIVWFGDRASGLFLYHRIQMSSPDNALEPESLQYLKDRNVLDLFPRSFVKYHEADEVFYLRAMQQVIDVSAKPFARRLEILNQIHNDLLAMENTYDDKGIAKEFFVAHILLKDVDRLMRIFAQDESALLRVLMVINRSLGQNVSTPYLDPFTGEPFEVRKVDGLYSVSGTMQVHPFRVPIFANEEPAN